MPDQHRVTSPIPQELIPLRIGRLDQHDLPLPRPALQRFFPLNRIANVKVLFIPDESRHPDLDRAALLAGEHIDKAGHA